VGVKGAFVKCLRGIKNALRLGIEVVLNPVITTVNYQELPDYIRFIKANCGGVQSISLSVIQPRGRAWDRKDLIPRYKIIDPYVRKALRLGDKYGLVINNPYCGLPLCIGGWYLYLERCVEYCENKLTLDRESLALNADKIKGPKCYLCDLSNFCNGVWKEYALIYPLTDLIPIINKNGKFRLYTVDKKM
jgi:MoaA/NifB/PqqE/SkfB family radical SAM enzyme